MTSLPAKPGLRLSVPEWCTNNQQLSDTAQHERTVSNIVRQEGRCLRDETNSLVGRTVPNGHGKCEMHIYLKGHPVIHLSPQTSWDERDTSRRLSDRIWDVGRWKEALEDCAKKVDEEMDALTLVTP